MERPMPPVGKRGATPLDTARALAVPLVLAALATFSTAPAALAAGGSRSGGLPEGTAFGLSGYVAVQRLDLGEFNALLTKVPPLPDVGWAAGFGVVVLPPTGWGFASSSATFRWESRDDRGMSRLRVAHSQVGLVRRWLEKDKLALTVGVLGGLATAEVELAEGGPETPDDFTMNRFTRRLVTLQPQLGLVWKVSRSASLHLSAGYLVATDFWNSRWAHSYGTTLPGVPALLHGPAASLALVVGSS